MITLTDAEYDGLKARIAALVEQLKRADLIELSISSEDWFKERDALLVTAETEGDCGCVIDPTLPGQFISYCDQHAQEFGFKADRRPKETLSEPTQWLCSCGFTNKVGYGCVSCGGAPPSDRGVAK